jgi:hypothetical protein
VGRCGLDSYRSGQGQLVGSCEHSTVVLDPIRGGEFPDWMSNY